MEYYNDAVYGHVSISQVMNYVSMFNSKKYISCTMHAVIEQLFCNKRAMEQSSPMANDQNS